MRHWSRLLLPVLSLLMLFSVAYAEPVAAGDTQPDPPAQSGDWDSGFWDQWQSGSIVEDADGSYEEIISDYEAQQTERDAIFQSILNGEYAKGVLRDVPEIILRTRRTVSLLTDIPWTPEEAAAPVQVQDFPLRSVLAGAFILSAAGITAYLLFRRTADGSKVNRGDKTDRIV